MLRDTGSTSLYDCQHFFHGAIQGSNLPLTNWQVVPETQSLQPLQPFPPHWPHCEDEQPPVLVDTGGALVFVPVVVLTVVDGFVPLEVVTLMTAMS